MESRVKEVLGVAKKKDGSEIRGQTNGKSWSMMRVILENDIELNMFAPVEVGDEVVELVQDPTYHSWKGKVKKTSKSMANMSDATTVLLTQILAELKSINENLIGGRPAQSKFDEFVEKKKELKREPDTVLEDIYDDPDETQVNKEFLDSIPF